MPRTDTQIHQIELLLTLDYLLKYTDEDHPATQLDICRHARKFGLQYNGGVAGDDIKRQKIGECLKYLRHITGEFPDEVPFVLEKTDGGKYYIESKNYLSDEQIIKILSAVKNDKYTEDEDTNFLIDTLLDTLSSVHKKEFFKSEVAKSSKGVKKISPSANRKYRLVQKALNENKMVKIRWVIYEDKEPKIFDFWYRVYKIKEYRNKPYAILVPIDTGDIIFYKGFIFDEVEKLNIPTGPDREVLLEDFNPKRNLDKLFQEKAKWIHKYYNSVDDMLEQNKMPMSGIAFKVSFYFKKVFLKFVKPSFEEFFSCNLDYEGCKTFKTIDEEKITLKDDRFYIKPDKLKEGEEIEYYVVNTVIDPEAFMSWLLSDVHGTGSVSFNDIVTVVGPAFFKRRIYRILLGKAGIAAMHVSEKEAKVMHDWFLKSFYRGEYKELANRPIEKLDK